MKILAQCGKYYFTLDGHSIRPLADSRRRTIGGKIIYREMKSLDEHMDATNVIFAAIAKEMQALP